MLENVMEFLFKGVLHLLTKINMFCALSQNYQHNLKNDRLIILWIVQGIKYGI